MINNSKIRNELEALKNRFIFLQNMINNLSPMARALYDVLIVDVRNELAQTAFHTYSEFGHNIRRILTANYMLHSGEYPLKIGNVLLFDFIDAYYEKWRNFKKLCERTGQEPSIQKYEEEEIQKNPNHPFNSPKNLSQQDKELILRIRNEWIKVVEGSQLWKYGGAFCSCLDFVKHLRAIKNEAVDQGRYSQVEKYLIESQRKRVVMYEKARKYCYKECAKEGLQKVDDSIQKSKIIPKPLKEVASKALKEISKHTGKTEKLIKPIEKIGSVARNHYERFKRKKFRI